MAPLFSTPQVFWFLVYFLITENVPEKGVRYLEDTFLRSLLVWNYLSSILIHDSLTDWIINSGGKPFPLKVLRALFFCFLAFAFATWGRSDSQSFRMPCCCYCYFSSSWNFGILSLPLIFYIFKIMGFSTTLFLSLSWASHHLFKFRILCPSGLGFFLNRFYFCLFVYFFTFAFPGTHWLDLGPYRWNLLCLLTFLSNKVSKLVLSKCRWKYVYLCVCVICKAWRVMRS